MAENNEEFWKRKLMAYLHDPPDKCLDIRGHEELARLFMAGAGFSDTGELARILEEIKQADHFASSAERFVFPKVKCSTAYSGRKGSTFVHPVSSVEYVSEKELSSQAGHIHGILQDAAKGIENCEWRKRFFLYWRRWMENAAVSEKESAEHLAFLPADTRIPDHSIWNHMAITSALAGCIEDGKIQPALLLFQMGPVQDFIAQARSTRDLWSGSYLLSWLVAHAMKAVSDRIGPDSIIFPNLRGNGIFDALHKDEMYQEKWKDRSGSEMATWDRMKEEKGQCRFASWLLTPTLPNRFLAIVPRSQAENLAQSAKEAVETELGNIGQSVWRWIEDEAVKAGCAGTDNWKERWDCQIKAFPQITWAVQPWLDRETCLAEFAALPVNKNGADNAGGKSDPTPSQRLQDMLDFGEKWLPKDDRDARFYSDCSKKETLNDPGILWSAHYALVDAKLAARRNTRDFNAWNNPFPESCLKDSLSGKEEVIGDEKFWQYLLGTYGKGTGNIFTSPGHRYGAMNLIKRLWCRSDKVPYLLSKLGLKEGEFKRAVRFDSVEDVARRNRHGGSYVAILAMDGDDMGKWVSGEKTPEFLKQVSENAREYLAPILERQGRKYLRRMLTPSYHLQISESLANFATWLAEAVVNKFDGQLIYAGGDDVLAMLPADMALDCAEALRSVFRGEPPRGHSSFDFAVIQPGFVNANAGYPLAVPGPAAEVSAGIAVGHFKAPLQMLVREARKAEKRAKKECGKGALAISVYKRSGEILEWGCKWDDGGGRIALELMRLMTEFSNNDSISSRFPYALAELVAPYELEKKGRMAVSNEEIRRIILQEFAHVCSRQGEGLSNEERDKLLALAGKWIEQCGDKPEDFVKLFLVETFMNRQRGEE